MTVVTAVNFKSEKSQQNEALEKRKLKSFEAYKFRIYFILKCVSLNDNEKYFSLIIFKDELNFF